MSGGFIFAQLLNVLVTPLTAIMASLLYLKTRKAGGESLRDASDQFEALDIPQSKWQARMKTRWTNAHPLDIDRSRRCFRCPTPKKESQNEPGDETADVRHVSHTTCFSRLRD
jgi:hypothetical protein